MEESLLKIVNGIARMGSFTTRRLVLFLVNMLAAPPNAAPVHAFRCRFMRLIGFRMGPGSQLSENLYVYQGRHFEAGSGCRLGSFCRIWDFSPITIGNNLLASHGLTLISGTHLLDQERTPRPGPITIGNNVWIGINVTIVGPSTIGDNVIIGANSLVTGDLASDAVYAGSPARFIRKLDYQYPTSPHPGDERP
ncbi:acyltransferase [Acidobacteria bacterium AB60]|nr:acyltransferase [Acidobacteria bacterium AB60]